MAGRTPDVPEIAGRAIFVPPYSEWPGLMEKNRGLSASWDFRVADKSATELISLSRAELLESALHWSRENGLPVWEDVNGGAGVVLTGHQPELYHCGVWVKQLALRRFASQHSAAALDVVVDSDTYDDVGFDLPCREERARCRFTFAARVEGACYAYTDVPTPEVVERVVAEAAGEAETVSGETAGRVRAFGERFTRACASSSDIATAVVKARREHEGPESGYAELPVSVLGRSEAFLSFAADVILRADEFWAVHNAELARYRSERRLRSAVRPFPDLESGDGAFELPLWVLGPRRSALWVRKTDEGLDLLAGGRVLGNFSADPATLVKELSAARLPIAPRAVSLTLFTRLFCSDLFIHGVGGARYDEVTDNICRRFYGIEPPQFVTVSLTMRLSGDAGVPGDSEVADLKARINRLEHSPDEAVESAGLQVADREKALAFVAEKRRLVAEIARPDADRKALGAAIRTVNSDLAELVLPLRRQLEIELARLESDVQASKAMASREYPYFLWSPEEVEATL